MKTLEQRNISIPKQELLKDLPQCIEIAERCLEPYWRKEFLERHAHTGSGFLITKSNDTPEKRVAGFMIFNLEPNAIFLTSLAVLPNHRRQGIARYMVAQLLDMADAHGVRFLEIYTKGEFQ